MATDPDDLVELLFFDTFSHEINDDLNLDLVQFPKPVYITEVRIIPLGARVQADFPGGVRLGATNPSKFGIEFFVNDLGKPGASTFENLGTLEYNQNDCINLECENDKIPTDGLVLRGWYTTITLAVYGTLTKHLAEQIASPPPSVENATEEETLVLVPVIIDTGAGKDAPKAEWRDDIIPSIEVQEPEEFVEPERAALFEDGFEGPAFRDEPFYPAENTREVEKRKRKSRSMEQSPSRNRTHSHSDSNDREYSSRSKREWSRSPEYRHTRRPRRDDHSEREHKRPRSPPQQSVGSPLPTRRPRSPEHDQYADASPDIEYKYRHKGKPIRVIGSSQDSAPRSPQPDSSEPSPAPPQIIEDDNMSQEEHFEPILSDDEIPDDNEEAENDELEMDDAEIEDAIRHFNPFKQRIRRHLMDLSVVCLRDCELLLKVLKKYETQTQVSCCENFLNSSSDEKENFVIVSEQLVGHLQQVNLISFRRGNYILERTFDDQNDYLKLAALVLKVGLDFDCACSQPQPGYKIRHIKIGARLAEFLCLSSKFFDYLSSTEGFDPFRCLFELYEKEYMALSIKLIILKSIYSILDTKQAVTAFTNNKINGYRRLLTIFNSNPLTRSKFAIKAIVKKINLYECLEKIRESVTKQFALLNYIPCSYVELELSLKQVLNVLTVEALSYQQPKRLLPVSAKFEIGEDVVALKSWSHMLHSYFRIHALVESLLLIVSNQTTVPPTLVNEAYTVIESLIRLPVGMDYLIEECFETTDILVKSLLAIDEYDEMYDLGDATEAKSITEDHAINMKDKKNIKILTHGQKLGVEMAYRIQTRYHVDAIKNSKDNTDVVIEHLHLLYCQICSNLSRKYTVETLGTQNQIIPFISLIEKERKAQTQKQQGSPGAKFKSPILSYSVDLVDACVRHSTNLEYLVDHGTVLLELVKNHEIFEPSVSAVLQEMAVYLKPVEIINNFSYDNISQLCDVIKRSIEYITTFPGDLIMGLRILRFLGVCSDVIETKELKYRYVILQFYSADGILTMINIFEKLNTYFEQPGLHSPTLMTTQAVQACQILLPALEVLTEMLTFVIECRDTQFKDLSAIEHLIKSYTLMDYYPETSQAYDEAQKVKSVIIKLLLAYTQPNPEDEESVHKSLWTLMIREVIKGVIHSPSTFIPGLKILAELLPLPLPVQTLQPMLEAETQRLVTDRKLWSAHLHPESVSLTNLIQTISPSTFPQLKDLLTRVCLQMADLAPNMTLLVSKAVTDMILTEGSGAATPGTASLARLLHFLGQLTVYASVKISSLSIFSGRLYELFNQILLFNSPSETHQLCQRNVHRIYENFFDSEISMIAPNTTGSLELNLACALPSRELMAGMITAIVTNLIRSLIGGSVSIAASRNLIILTEHDITFYHLRAALDSKKESFQEWMKLLVESHTKGGADCGLLGTIIVFLRALLFIDESAPDSTLPNRTLKLNAYQLSEIIGWKTASNEVHPLQKIKHFLSKGPENKNDELLQDLNSLLVCLENCTPEPIEAEDNVDTSAEPFLPQAEGIVTQYLNRPMYTIYEASDEPQLNASYWLEPIRLDGFVVNDPIALKNERVACDLAEMVQTCLPPDTNLSSDCKRILHLSASPQSNRERTATAPCFRTRRVEVEPTTGRPEKKIFVTPMRGRGFARTPPSRGDLFRSRPPNTSRPPSLHVDDFLALETCGAQPTGPTGYNKLSRDIISIRGTRGRGRGSRIGASAGYRTSSPSTWGHGHSGETVGAPPLPQHFRTATSEPVVTPQFGGEPHYAQAHFGGAPIRSRGRGRARTFIR